MPASGRTSAAQRAMTSIARRITMALYKNGQHLEQTNDPAFDRISEPGMLAPNPGIYRCEVCGREIAIAAGHTLPPQNHSSACTVSANPVASGRVARVTDAPSAHRGIIRD
jgi:hypothetical protein